MQLLAVCAIAAAAAARCPYLCQAAVHLSCDCRLWHRRDTAVSLHCTRGQSESSETSCQKAQVTEIPRGYRYVPGYALIKLHRTLKPWLAAKKTCEHEGAQLAVPRDRHAFDGLKQFFTKGGLIHWGYLGISDQISEGVFAGLDGRPVSYVPWMPNQPDNKGGNEDCVDLNSDGLSNDVNCATIAPFFCERRLSVGVPDGYAWLEEAGRFYKVHTETRVRADAAEACRSENASLAVPDTWVRGEALLTLLDIGPQQFFLVGFTDEATEGDFVTQTGRHLNDMEFQVWGVNEPNNNVNGKPENCLVLAKRGYYNDVLCDQELPFICEIEPV